MGKARLMGALALVRAPQWATDLWYTGRLRQVDGRVIDSKAQALGTLLDLVRAAQGPQTVGDSRRGLAALAAKFDKPRPKGVKTRDIMVPGGDAPRPARLYDAQTLADNEPRPTLLYIHGGGWVQGDLDTHDGLCGKMAAWAGIRVISLDYRLAPEHKFPAGADDVLACYRALRDSPGDWGVDPDRIMVGGDSAGANLTAVLMHDLQGTDEPLPAGQLLIYPAVDTAMNSASMQALREAYVLPVDRIAWYLDLYLPEGQDRSDPRVAPAFSRRLAGQPDAFVVIAGHDPLRDDGVLYADLLTKAGVKAELVEFPGQIHAFVSVTGAIPQGNETLRACADWLRGKIG